MSKLKFLVVEDDLFYQTYVNDLLAETGVDIINATDGEAGLALAIAETPDLIITDIEIPKIQGFVFFKSLRERPETKDIPVIMVSGKVEKALLDRHAGLSIHAEGYLVKPFSGQVLIEMIRDVIGEDFGYSEVDIHDVDTETGISPEPEEEESAPEVTQFPEEIPGDQEKTRELTVLVVDDSRYICDITRDFLEELGIIMEMASDGETGYKMASDLLPDLILLDVQMPNMNGFVVCEMLRKQETTTNIPIVLMSAVVDDESFQRHSRLRYHADAYLQKPFMKTELHELVRRFTSPGDQVSADLESKTGFFVPSEEESETDGDAARMTGSADQKLVEDLEQARLELRAGANRESQLEAEIDSIKKVKDHLEAEIFELKKTVEGTQDGLQGKLTLATQRFEEARIESEKLAEEKSALQARLAEFTPDEAISDEEFNNQLMEMRAKLQEASAVGLELENRNKILEEEAADLRSQAAAVTDPPVDSGKHEELLKEIEALKRDLTAATTAKSEIEDQAGQFTGMQSELEKARSESEELRQKLLSMPEDTGAELTTLQDKLSDAIERAESLEEERDSLLEELNGLKRTREHNNDLEKVVEDLKKEREESQKFAASETQARMDLEGRLDRLEEAKTLLEGELEEAKRQLDEQEEAGDKAAGLQTMLEEEKNQRASAEEKLAVLKGEVEEKAEADEKAGQLEKDNQELRSALREARKRCELLEKEAELRGPSGDAESQDGQAGSQYLEGRFNKLEDALEKTVREAQNVLKDQKDRESALEESVESLMRSLEEERAAYGKERENWNAREGELRDAFEDALKESRRLMGEEAARLYPMHIPRQSRPLEVVTRGSKYGIAAAAVVIAMFLFAGGYLLKSKGTSTSSRAALPVGSQPAPVEAPVPGGMTVEPWIASSGPEESYEDLWRRNTVQSISDDMMIQATLHTREELEAAIKYTASKEGWTRERIQKAMADMAKTYNLSGSFYITVYSKNLKGGYPGYADSFVQHIALRDHSGKEVRACFPGELEGSKFITSRVSAAGKEMNPVFLYEVGQTVAFARKGLAAKPQGLQLVLYDIGAVPMRVLTWDMAGIGSLSNYESALKETADS